MSTEKKDVCVVGGCGHVGLPLAVLLAHKGMKVDIYDINRDNVERSSKGDIPFYEEGMDELLKEELQNGRLFFSYSPEIVANSDVVILIVGTPVDEHLNPEFNVVKCAIADIEPYINNDQLLILRSTVYPGTTRRVRDWLEEQGKTPDIAFCPERILEGKAIVELESLPQIVSSYTQSGVKRCKELFYHLTDDIVVVEPMEAELAKLYSNVWRYIKFAVSNQFFTIANDYGLDFYNIYYAMTHNYSRCQDFPTPGFAAGPCLFKDTMQLGAFNNNDFHLGHAAMLINEGLPNYIFKRLKMKHDLTKMTIGILGMSFKAESDDIRESLSFKIKKIAEFEAKQVLCSDMYVHKPEFVTEEELIEKSDLIIIAAPHKRYKSLKFNCEQNIVDIWNLLGKGGKI